jgi:hypothetical protein
VRAACFGRHVGKSLAPTPVSRRVDVSQAAGRKLIAESLSQHDEKHVVPTPLSGIRVGKIKKKKYPMLMAKISSQYKIHQILLRRKNKTNRQYYYGFLSISLL